MPVEENLVLVATKGYFATSFANGSLTQVREDSPRKLFRLQAPRLPLLRHGVSPPEGKEEGPTGVRTVVLMTTVTVRLHVFLQMPRLWYMLTTRIAASPTCMAWFLNTIFFG